MRSVFMAATSVALFSGCVAPPSKLDYTPPTEKQITNYKKVGANFETTWNKLIKELSEDFFVINNVEKASGLINLSFSSKTPTSFINCGETKRTFISGGKESAFEYRTSDSADYVTRSESGRVFSVKRTTSLDGRINILVSPEKDGTGVLVNAKYVFTVSSEGHDLVGRYVGTDKNTLDFSTKSAASNGVITCQSSGSIERRILHAAGE